MNLPTFILSAMLAAAAIGTTLKASGSAAAVNAAVCAVGSAASALLWLGQSGWKSTPRRLWLGTAVAVLMMTLWIAARRR